MPPITNESMNIPAFFGDGYLRDIIMWPTVRRNQLAGIVGVAIDPNEDFPLTQITAEQLMVLMWRVREWEFTGHWEVTVHIGPPFNVDNTMTQTPKNTPTPIRGPRFWFRNDLTTSSEILSEFYLMKECFAPTAAGKKYQSDFGYPLRSNVVGFVPNNFMTTLINGIPTVDQFTFSFALQQDFRLPGFSIFRGSDIVVYESADNFSPYLTYTANAGGGGVSYACSSQTTSPTNAVVEIDLKDACDPVSLPVLIDAAWTGGGTPPTVTITSFACDLKITAKKFFRYKNTLGQLIWNETTGAQEETAGNPNDPFA